MVSRIASLFFYFLLALPLLIAASAIPREYPYDGDSHDGHHDGHDHDGPHHEGGNGNGNTINQSQCNVEKQLCCNSVQNAQTNSLSGLDSLVGVLVNPIQILVGLQCTPISVLALAGNSCNAQPVCCNGNDSNGQLVGINCSPLNLNL